MSDAADGRFTGYLIEGERYPRVSTILNVLAKPGLEAWKAKIGHAEADRIARESAAYGTAVHKACERISLGDDPVDVGSDLVAANQQRMLEPTLCFARWYADHVAETLGAERLVWSQTHRYAGKPDLLVVLKDGRTAIVDLKTSKSLSETYRLQLYAYKLALAEMGDHYEARLVVWIPSDQQGKLVVREYADDEVDRTAWLSMLHLYHWQALVRNDWREDRRLLEAASAAG